MQGGLIENETPYHEFYRVAINEFLSSLKQTTELTPYVDYVESFSDDVVEKVKKVFSRREGEFHVLNHGDCWMNNCLWRYDNSGNVVDVLAVDHQEGFFGSPGIDLNHFIYTSCQLEVLLNDVPQLVKVYHEMLGQTLMKLGVNHIPTKEDIEAEMRNKIDHGKEEHSLYLLHFFS